jgi:hypothetical protein
MKHAIKVLLVVGSLVVSSNEALASAFEDHTNWEKEPLLETEKGVSLGRSVMEMGMGFRYLDSTDFFNSAGHVQEAPGKYAVSSWDMFVRFGFTENWTFWANLPMMWSEQQDTERAHSASWAVGDSEVGALYQFYRLHDPTLSMGFSARWKLPTGNESPGAANVNITGTGTTDVDLSFIGRYQVVRNLSVGWGVGYNIRFPGAVQYLNDKNTSITNALLDLGDELYGQFDVTAAIEHLSLQVLFQYKHRFPTQVALAQFTQETIQWKIPGMPEGNNAATEDVLIGNGAVYHDWDVRELLDPDGKLVSSEGDLFSIVPKLIVRPLNWVDIVFFARFYLFGTNSIYLSDKDNDNKSFSNFLPMQTLGKKISMGGSAMVLGELGGNILIRW